MKAGITRNAWSILARNAKPTSVPASTIQRVAPRSSARVSAYAAATSRRTSSASGLLNRNMSAATGVSARTAPATSPASLPATRATVAYRIPTAATPMSAWGTRRLHELSPKMRTLRDMTHSAAGVLSTVIALPASNEPKRKASQLCEPARAAAE